MIGTRILKMDLEIAEIIEVKISILKVATLTSIISAISKLIFKILVPIT